MTTLLYTALQNDPKHLASLLCSETDGSTAHPHILFDCDGLILDTEPIYSHVALSSIKHLLSLHNKEATDSTDLFPLSIKLKVMGGSKEQVSHNMATYLSSVQNIPITADEWSAITTPLESHHFSLGCPLMPFIHETVNLFIQRRWPIAVATSSSRSTFLLKSQPHSDLFSNFHAITCGDDPDYSAESHLSLPSLVRPSVKGKPDPSIFRTARHHLNRSPSHPGIVLEDSPNGVVAALRSGHSCIWVPAKDVAPGFQLIDAVLKDYAHEIQTGLWVYRATSLQELVQ